MSKMRRGDLYDKKYYHSRRYNRRKRKIIAYTLRGAVFAAALLVLILIVCGVFFIKERLSPEKTEANGLEVQSGEETQEDHAATENTEEQEPSEPQPPKYLVVLDAGHGGKDEGTANGDAKEKDINLAVVLKMEELLREKGVELLLTREDDTFVKLADRAVIANDHEASLFVSIHCNSYDKDKRIKGLECYYHPDSDSGKELAEALCEKLKESGEIETRNARAEDYLVLRNTKCQAVLVEIGYLTNKEEKALLQDEEYQEKLAKELVEALCSINTEMISEEGPAD